MATMRVQVVESEKSPEVLQANWREEVILNKSLQVINRSQNTVVNRITVDQKIMNRRFQKKLQHSKTAYAKITGNKNLEISLRKKHTFVLNTNLGQGDEDDANLQKIWAVGDRRVDKLLNQGRYAKRAMSAPGPQSNRHQTRAPVVITLSAAELGIKMDSPRRGHSGSANSSPGSSAPPSRRPSTSAASGAVSIAAPSVHRRPKTVGDTRMRGRAMSAVESPQISVELEMAGPRVAFALDAGMMHKRVASVNNLSTNSGLGLIEQEFEDGQQGQFFKTITTLMTPTTPKTPNRQSSRGGGTNGSRGLGMSMFEGSGEADITLLDIHKLRTRAANYTGRVQTFCTKLKSMREGQDIPVADYYSSRLSDYAKAGRGTEEWRLPGTPESETLREMGNTHVKSLTMKNLSQDFTMSRTQIAY